ncbi:hypothetical protein ABIC65_001047 [Sphingomonas trueperi]|uniref:hypothetical protein n=1 Tax=Sphingomonas trueperi TaxID=53317 RepID=UPI00339604A5
MRGYFIEAILLLAMLWLIGWGLVKLYYLARREGSTDHNEYRRVKTEAEDALNDLERAVQRATKKRGRGGARNRKA